MTSSLKKQAIHGAFWSFAERFGQQGVQFVVAVILARLLEPKDFGVIVMIMLLCAIAQSIVDSGFGQALIQKHDEYNTDESTVFWFNMLVIGKLFALAGLGFYERSKKLLRVASQSVAQVVSQVNFPIISSLQDYPERMLRFLRKVLQYAMAGTVPMMVGFGVTPPSAIHVL